MCGGSCVVSVVINIDKLIQIKDTCIRHKIYVFCLLLWWKNIIQFLRSLA